MKDKLTEILQYLINTPLELIQFDKLEALTGDVLADSDYEELPEELSRMLEVLDSPDLNYFTQNDIDMAIKHITNYILDRAWNKNWADIPIASALKFRFPESSLRIHSLPGGKRYPDNEAEMQAVIQRYFTALEAMRSETDMQLIVIVSKWTSSLDVPEVNPETFGLRGSLRFWRTIDNNEDETNPDFKSYVHKYVAYISQTSELKRLLELVAEDKIADVIIGPKDMRWLFHPYDGGADMFVQSDKEKAFLSQKFINWIE